MSIPSHFRQQVLGRTFRRVCDDWQSAFQLAKQRGGIIKRRCGGWVFQPKNNAVYELFFDDERELLKKIIFRETPSPHFSNEKIEDTFWAYIERDAKDLITDGLINGEFDNEFIDYILNVRREDSFPRFGRDDGDLDLRESGSEETEFQPAHIQEWSLLPPHWPNEHTVPDVVNEFLQEWAALYDDPEKAQAAIIKATKRNYRGGHDTDIAPILKKFFLKIAAMKPKPRASSLEFDLPSIIEIALAKTGNSPKHHGSAKPRIDNADENVDYGELTPEEWESLSDPGSDVTDP